MTRKSYDIVLLFPPIREWDNPRNFPTGTGLIAAQLRHHGFRVKVIDVNGLRLSEEEVLEQLAQLDPAVIGVGGIITTYGWIQRITRRIRTIRPQTPIVLGGSVGTSITETALRNLDIDVIVMGEGENTILELLPVLLNHQTLETIAGLAYLQNNEVVLTPTRAMIEDLDELPFPAWDMFPMQVYLQNPVVGVGRDIDIISSRGCPFGCQYCYRHFGRKYRARSAAHVVGEMEALKRNYDIDFISFQDDCFVVDKKRIYEICALINQSKLLTELRWSCTGRVTLCDLELLKRMRASGCISVSYGIESGSQQILNNMNKSVTLDQARSAIENTRKAGLRCPVSFMIGYPGETRETVMETVEFCRRLNIPLTALMFTCPYPGTELYEQVRKRANWYFSEEEFVLKMGDAVDLTVNLTDIPDQQLLSLRDEALQKARENYTAPSPEEVEQQDKELYGETLYQKSVQQMRDPRRHKAPDQVDTHIPY